MNAFFNDKKQVNIYRQNYNLLDANKSFFYVMVLTIFMPIIFAVLMGIIGVIIGVNVNNTLFAKFLTTIAMSISFLILFLYYNKKNKINPIYELGVKNKFNIWYLLISIFIGAICVFVLAPFINLIQYPFELLGFEGNDLPYEMNTWYTIILGIIGYAVVPAVCEELVFRGMIQKGSEKRFSPFVTVLISTLCFTIMHGSLQQTFYQLILGAVAGCLFLFTKNITYSMVFHFVNNLIVTIMEIVGTPAYLDATANYFDYSTFGGVVLPILFALIGGAVIFGLIYLVYVISKKTNSNSEFIVEGENIIIEEKDKKLTLKHLFSGQNLSEKSYFVLSWVLAIVIWISGTISLFM